MATCTGNDFIFSIYICMDVLVFRHSHEKDETCRDTFPSTAYGPACIVNKNMDIQIRGSMLEVTQSKEFKEVDDISSIYIENIIAEYDQSMQKQENERNERDMFMIGVFCAYVKYVTEEYITYAELNLDLNEKFILGDFIHWILIAPDEWYNINLEAVKQHIISTNVKSVDNIIIIQKADSLIRHIQIPHYKHLFSNGEYWIVCLLDAANFATFYGYEIGPPIKGLKNASTYTLKEMNKLSVHYDSKKYLLDTVFNKDKEELEKYNINLDDLVNVSHFQNWIGDSQSFLNVLEDLGYLYSDNITESFLLEKKVELESITSNTFRENRSLSCDSYLAIKNTIIEISQDYQNTKVLIVNNSGYISKKIIQRLIDMLPTKFRAKHHNYNLTEGSIIGTGAIKKVQDNIKRDNYIPKVKNKEVLNRISEGDILYFDLNWNNNTVLYVSSKNKETSIKDTFNAIDNCYPLEDCFEVIKHKNQFHVSKINITNNYKRMLGLLDNKKLSNTREKNIQEDEKVDELLDRKIVPDTLKKAEPQRLFNSHLPYSSSKLISHVPRRYQKEMLIEYITCFQKHIIHHLISKNVLKREDKLTYYFSIDKSVLDTFVTEHEEIRTVLEKESIITQCIYPIKLIHREQVSAVHCKDTIECFKRVEEYLDYPQHMMQVQMNPTYIDLTLNVIMPLHKDITLSNNETVITLKRKRIQYNMVDVIGDLLWNHIQSGEEYLIKKCHEHDQSEHDDNANMYLQFINCFSRWFTREYTTMNSHGEIDFYKKIHLKMSSHCECNLILTPIDMFDICIIPAIQQVMAIVYGATTNISIFGEYRINHIVLMGSIMNTHCKTTNNKTLQLLEKCIRKENKYYNHIKVHWINDEVLPVVYKGIRSIKFNPLGGLLEQYTTGAYYVQYTHDIFTDFDRSQVLKKGEYLKLTKEANRITENLRENGSSTLLYFEDTAESDLYFLPNNEALNHRRHIGVYDTRNVDSSYPITLKFVNSIDETIITIGSGAEGNSHIFDANTDNYHLRENLLFFPYI
ncbi:hypothetical protein BDB01DRAFT_788439 [Pilobolus umbonatus]|nr:hypothetical protein BDB01DRAFT_788439 [Pilobolus umbonatus]